MLVLTLHVIELNAVIDSEDLQLRLHCTRRHCFTVSDRQAEYVRKVIFSLLVVIANLGQVRKKIALGSGQ